MEPSPFECIEKYTRIHSSNNHINPDIDIDRKKKCVERIMNLSFAVTQLFFFTYMQFLSFIDLTELSMLVGLRDVGCRAVHWIKLQSCSFLLLSSERNIWWCNCFTTFSRGVMSDEYNNLCKNVIAISFNRNPTKIRIQFIF